MLSIAELLLIAQNDKQPKSQSRRIQYSHIMKYYKAVKKKSRQFSMNQYRAR